MDAIPFGLPFHPYADIFPLLEGDEFDALVTDIEAKGLLQPIILLDGAILDGRNRYRACLETLGNVKVRTEEYTGKDPLGFVISANLKRRHLDESQRAMVAAKLANMQRGGDKRSSRNQNANLQNDTATVKQPDAAKLLNVSTRSVLDAAAVNKTGIPELGHQVEQGKLSVSLAAKVAKMPPAEQRKVLDTPAKQQPGAVKKARRAEREKDLGDATKAASESTGTKLYNVIYADPPWRFEPHSRDTGMDRAADNHYPTLNVTEICMIPVPAAEDCVLFLWATAPMLKEAMIVMEAWGFTYKSHCVWNKDRQGTGYWFRNMHELLLVGTKGNIPAPAPGTQYPSVIDAPVTKHSAKPIHFAEMIEEMFPNAALLEMFARTSRAGWDSWGNEAGER